MVRNKSKFCHDHKLWFNHAHFVLSQTKAYAVLEVKQCFHFRELRKYSVFHMKVIKTDLFRSMSCYVYRMATRTLPVSGCEIC